jgi:hypothetical protein
MGSMNLWFVSRTPKYIIFVAMNLKRDFESLPLDEQLRLVGKGVYIGSTKKKGVLSSLFLMRGPVWVEMFYHPDGQTIDYMALCPEFGLAPYLEGYDIMDMAF